MKDIDYIIWLNSIHGIGLATIERFIKYFGSLDNLWKAPANEIYDFPNITKKVADKLIETRRIEYINKYKERLLSNKVKCIIKSDILYPERLKNIEKPPRILYVKGNIIQEDCNAIAIIGSRRCTSYGKNIAYRFAKEMAGYGITIISGMAYGIDSAAHRGALDGGGRTIAVLGCGVDICYPKNNVNLMKKIIENGAVISEYSLGTQPRPGNFPTRNRIIAGLSKGVLVVEAGLKSGTLITIDYALQQGKDVFAIPGNINCSVSKGTNKLIKEGAKPVTCVEDILEEYNIRKQSWDYDTKFNDLSDSERTVIEVIKRKQPIHIDMISSILHLAPSTVNSLITILEIKDLVEQLPGKIIILK
ncbi:DNA-processing protein DprA [Paramaledivibacter caminithermalis]|uniref:DNA processing protein n=1 Tax=Paramaledivibacter caminithermalis (strain DSM 15212 / CIP 107654 / DViRD3) TaxID=1121301 RepID=A0A1M6NL60_PARC5|nr:DNA-processing protein DprA [Paramaledivibacter caminithermalis]SHJ96304.1 DNA processing protein [Paramaledivibacter caminithermalis DSM 15212]